jgi:hypothetical protein
LNFFDAGNSVIRFIGMVPKIKTNSQSRWSKLVASSIASSIPNEHSKPQRR